MQIAIENGVVKEWLGLSDKVYNDLSSNIQEDFEVARNQFLNAVVNKIGATRVNNASIYNPFKKYDSYPVEYGDTIEDIFTPVIMGYDYDITTAGTRLLEAAKPPVKAQYTKMEYKKQYKVTTYDYELRLAVKNEYRLVEIIDSINKQLFDSADLDEYFAFIAMLSSNLDMYANGIEEVSTTAEYKAKDMTRKLVDVGLDFGYNDSVNNAMQVINPTPVQNRLIVIKQEALTDINLDFLSGQFNLNKIDLLKNIIPIKSFIVPVWNDKTKKVEMKGNDIDFVIIDDRALIIHPALTKMGRFENPEGLYINRYYNKWKYYSYGKYGNARAFKFNVTEPTPDPEPTPVPENNSNTE